MKPIYMIQFEGHEDMIGFHFMSCECDICGTEKWIEFEESCFYANVFATTEKNKAFQMATEKGASHQSWVNQYAGKPFKVYEVTEKGIKEIVK